MNETITFADVQVGDVVRFTPSRYRRRVTIRVTDHHDGASVGGYPAVIVDGETYTRGDRPLYYYAPATTRVEVLRRAPLPVIEVVTDEVNR